MEKNKRNKIIGLSIGILIVLIIVVSSTYAYWQITRTQETPNDIVAACLNLDLEDVSESINLDSAWPISDEEGKNLTGYTFTVTNNCDEEINYIVGLNRVEEESANYLLDSSIKLQLDDNSTHVYGELSDVEYSDAENTEYTARSSKQVSVETIEANGTNTHTIRVWINDEAPVTEQSKTFLGQVFITGGQGIEIPETSCFEVGNNGLILGYDETCGNNVKIPAEINGIPIKIVGSSSFRDGDALLITLNASGDNYRQLLYYRDTTYKNKIDEFAKSMSCEDEANELSECLTILNDIDEYNSFNWNDYATDMMIYTISYNEKIDSVWLDYSIVEHIDLSEAKYLESIAISTYFEGDNNTYIEPINDTCIKNQDDDNYTCKRNLKSLILPENGVLKTIGGYLDFCDCQLTELKIPASVETIGRWTFSGNQISSLIFEDTVEIPSKLAILGDGAFDQNSLTKVIIPGSVTSIGEGVFDSNSNLSEIIIKRTEEDAIANVTFGSAWSGSATVTYNPDYTE